MPTFLKPPSGEGDGLIVFEGAKVHTSQTSLGAFERV